MNAWKLAISAHEAPLLYLRLAASNILSVLNFLRDGNSNSVVGLSTPTSMAFQFEYYSSFFLNPILIYLVIMPSYDVKKLLKNK